jgi:transposase-like protein
MKSSKGFERRRRRRTSPNRRLELLAAFEDSGMSAAAFARQQGIGYTTFCGWRHRRAKAPPAPAFVEVEVSAPAAAVEVWIELGAHARLRLTSAAQVELAARFLHRFHALGTC